MSSKSGDAAGLTVATAPDTVPKLLLRNKAVHAGRPAMRHKDLGIWQSWTWGQMHDEIRALAVGLRKLGLERGDRVAIIGPNRPRLYWTFCAVQSLGGVPVPIYQDQVGQDMAYVLGHAGVRFAVVHNQEQVDKVASIGGELPTLEHMIYDDPRGLKDYGQKGLHDFERVMALGRTELAANAEAAAWWLDEINAGHGADVSVMLYTSGTTGKPKGVMLTHDNVVKSGQNANLFDHFTPDDTMIAYLPMAWAGDHIFTYAQAYAGALCVACPESAETAPEDRREVGPTYFFAPPRVFETLLTQIMVRMEDAGGLKKWLFKYFMDVARRVGEPILDGKSVGAKDRVLYWLGNKIIYAPLRNRMGFSNLRVGYTAGEAIGPELFRFYRSLGINLKQLYGQTEASVFITLQPDGEVFPETVGKPGPGVEIRVSDTGEVQFKSPGVFKEYYNNPQATADTKSADGWVHTGDAGFIDGRGHLVIIDRQKDVGRLKDGTMFSPKYVENRLKFYPEIKEAVAFGDGRDYVAMFINVDPTSVGNWAERNNISYASYQELAGHPQVVAMITERIGELNRALAAEPRVAGSQVRRFLILPKELEADDGELTQTLKVRRSFVLDRYASLIKALYDGSPEGFISVEVTFEDGRKGRIEGRMPIVDLPLHGVAPLVPVKEAAE